MRHMWSCFPQAPPQGCPEIWRLPFKRSCLPPGVCVCVSPEISGEQPCFLFCLCAHKKNWILDIGGKVEREREWRVEMEGKKEAGGRVD